ncbi:MAG TPA: methyltransferase domain-containing protein [Solirubrobacteraceae bacterium]|nr:methyltransferase domain-containing protein [Solirubrobacteraceae bacterium]
MSESTRTDAARRAVAENPGWYHTIELAPGVVTPGEVDLRRAASAVLPPSLSGQRALDVGTFDGFWAFELERRGAETVAIDVDTLDRAEWPPLARPLLEQRTREWGLELGLGFRLAAAALGSNVERVTCPVYELSPERIGGTVDMIFSGAILLHLRDPTRALERMHATLRDGGRLIVLEPFSMRETLLHPRRPVAHFEATSTDFNWWLANVAGLRAMLRAAGFADVRSLGFHRPKGRGVRYPHVGLCATARGAL